MSEKNSELVWYIAREGQQHGPLSDVEMRLFVDSGHLKPNDLVWNQDLPEWKPADSIFPPKAAPKPPPPPPPPPQPPKAAKPEPNKTKLGSGSQTSHKPEDSSAKPQPTLTAALSSGGSASKQSPYAADSTAASSGSATSAATSSGSTLPSPDDVLPSFRTQRSPREAPSAAGDSQPAPVDGHDEEDDYDDEAPRGRGRVGMLLGTAAVVAALVGGGYLAYQNQDAILSYMNEQAGGTATANNAPPVVKADAGTKTASLETPAAPPAAAPPASDSAGQSATQGPRIEGITVTIPPTQPTNAPSDDQVPLTTIDSNLQKSQLWRVVKAEFPEWYQERVTEISKLSNSASETDLSKHLIGKLVALRREHASQALASSTGSLQSVASAFLANLKSLAGHSTQACYTFISRGETSPAVIALFPKPGYGDAIEGQIAAVFRAVADGRSSPVQRAKASKPDYDVLAGELTKIGWSKADLGLFSNPQALAKAPPEQVCKMVQDWFTAHLAIEDKSVQERLLVETLRPVIAG